MAGVIAGALDRAEQSCSSAQLDHRGSENVERPSRNVDRRDATRVDIDRHSREARDDELQLRVAQRQPGHRKRRRARPHARRRSTRLRARGRRRAPGARCQRNAFRHVSHVRTVRRSSRVIVDPPTAVGGSAPHSSCASSAGRRRTGSPASRRRTRHEHGLRRHPRKMDVRGAEAAGASSDEWLPRVRLQRGRDRPFTRRRRGTASTAAPKRGGSGGRRRGSRHRLRALPSPAIDGLQDLREPLLLGCQVTPSTNQIQ